MDWTQFLILIATFAGLFFWSRSESRSDHLHLDTWMKTMLQAIHDEMKDFHGRLCALEEKVKKKQKE